MADGFYRLTYRDIAERLGISPDAARMKANRKAKAGHWRLLPDEAPGGERLVEIPSADLDGMLAKAAAAAERSALAPAAAEQPAPVRPAATAEHPAPVPPPATAEHPAAAAPTAEHSPTVEPYVPPKVSVSFAPEHPHMPPATVDRSASAEPIPNPEQPATAEQAAAPEQTVDAEQAVEAEQPAPAEAVANAGPANVQAEPRSANDDFDLDEIVGAETGDTLVATLTARVATLTNRLLEETAAREKASDELAASAVRESELKVEIERLSARVAELTAAADGDHRPWWRKMIQGGATE